MESAARAAATSVLESADTKRRQYRLVALACLLSVVAVLALVLPTAIWLDRDRQRANLDRARFNCDQQTKSVVIQRDILQIGTDLRRDNRDLGQDKRVRAAVLEVFGRELVKELYAKQAANEHAAVVKWDRKLAALRALARVDCDAALVESGVRTTPGPTTITTRPAATTTTPRR